MKALTLRQQRFVAAYNGNATEAAIQAGYSPRTARSMGQENLTKPDIQKAIQNREGKRTESSIMTRHERQEFWTSIARDPEADVRDRMRASELLGRSEGDFLDRVGVTNEGDASMPGVWRIKIINEGADERRN